MALPAAYLIKEYEKKLSALIDRYKPDVLYTMALMLMELIFYGKTRLLHMRFLLEPVIKNITKSLAAFAHFGSTEA